MAGFCSLFIAERGEYAYEYVQLSLTGWLGFCFNGHTENTAVPFSVYRETENFLAARHKSINN